MPSQRAILISLKRLFRNCRAGVLPTAEELPDLAADWAVLLHDLDDEALEDAVTGYLRGSSPFWPTAGQILAASPARRLEAVDDSDAAWGGVLRLISAEGRKVEDPEVWERVRPRELHRAEAVLAGVAALGGWARIGASMQDEHAAMRASFRAAYRATVERVKLRAETDAARAIGGRSVAQLVGDGPRRGGFGQIMGGKG